MKTTIFKIVAILGLATLTLSFDFPIGWDISGSRPKSYDMGVDKDLIIDNQNVMTIKSKRKMIIGYGSITKDISPTLYLNKRIRLSGYLKTKDVKAWTGFLLRVDQNKENEPLAFDNMSERNIEGTTDWKKYEIVLDVPSNATNIEYGTMLTGGGQVWFYGVTIEVVDASVAVTGTYHQKKP